MALSMNNGGSASGPPTPSVEEDQISQGGWHFFSRNFLCTGPSTAKERKCKKEYTESGGWI